MSRTRGVRIFAVGVQLALLFASTVSRAEAVQPSSAEQQREEYIRAARQCGPVALWLTLAYYGRQDTIKGIANRCKMTEEGTSLQAMVEFLRSEGFRAEAVRITPKQLMALKSPLIATMKGETAVHFVFVPRATQEYAWTLDSERVLKLKISDFVNNWEGTGIVIGESRGSTSSKLAFIVGVLLIVVSAQICGLAVARHYARRRCISKAVSLLLVYGIISALSAHAAYASETTDGIGNNSLDAEKVDFVVAAYGDCIRGEKLEHSFPISNKTSQTMRLTIQQRTCSCTSVEFAQNELMAGQSTQMTIVMPTAASQPGPNFAQIVVGTGIESPPAMGFKLTYNVRLPVTASPAKLNVGENNISKGFERFVALKIDRELGVTALSAETDAAWLEVKGIVDSPATCNAVDLAKPPPAPTVPTCFLRILSPPGKVTSCGPDEATVRILATYAKGTFTEILKVSADFVGRTEPSQKRIVLTYTSQPELELALKNTSGSPLLDVKAEGTPDFVTCELPKPAELADKPTLRWRMNPELVAGTQRTTVTLLLTFQDGYEEQLRLPLVCVGNPAKPLPVAEKPN